MIETYEEALAFIHSRQKFKKSPTLDRMKTLMHKLGDPQKQLTMIHVTGTNGKGSTVAFLKALLMEQGLTVGTFTSPFITRFNERIMIDDTEISNQDLVRLTQRIQPLVEELDDSLPEGGPTEFEVVTALMLIYFAEFQPHVAIIEVGIGGTYDSTNIITPVISVITTIGMDHMQILGDTLEQIAAQKAGIIKPGVPVVTGKLADTALQVVEQVASQQASQLLAWGNQYQVRPLEHQLQPKFEYLNEQVGKLVLTSGLMGNYQMQNAAVAVTAFLEFTKLQHLSANPTEIRRALVEATWPGRMELINEEPAIFLDGAHNVPAIEALIDTIKSQFAHQRIYVVVAILADKQADQMIELLSSVPNLTLYLTTFAEPTTNRPAVSLQAYQNRFNTIKEVSDWQTGLIQVTQEMSADDVLIFTGSLYFISEIRNYFA